MKKLFKAVISAAVTLALLACMIPCMTVFADATTPTTTFEVNGIEEGSTVYAYAIALDEVDANGNHYWKYTSAGETQIKPEVESGSFDGATLGYIYTNINSTLDSDNHDGQGPATVDGIVVQGVYENGAYAFKNVKPGLYVITADKEGSSVTYNASIFPVNYQYNEKGEAYLPSGISFTVKKSSEPTIKKTVVEDGDNKKYSDANIGDVLDFEIEITVPKYDEAWENENSRFIITDTVSKGLTIDPDSVTIEGTTLANLTKKCDKTSYTTSTTGFTIDLRGEDMTQYSEQTIAVTYQATVNDKAAVNFAGDLNKAAVQWSKTAGSTDLSDPKEDTTHHYTFGIDTLINGTGSTTTSELTKYGVKTTTLEDNKVPLSGAEFQLYDANKNLLYFAADGKLEPDSTKTTALDHITSGANGQLTAYGLDAGTYYLKESKAPVGYALDKTEYKITISAAYNELTGELKSYNVNVNDQALQNVTFKYEKNDAGAIVPSSGNPDTFAINNTPMIQLPETGARGVIILTIAAIALMVVFGTLYFAVGKKRTRN